MAHLSTGNPSHREAASRGGAAPAGASRELPDAGEGRGKRLGLASAALGSGDEDVSLTRQEAEKLSSRHSSAGRPARPAGSEDLLPYR